MGVSDTYANMLPAVGRMMGSLVYRLYCLDHIAMMLQVLLTDKVTSEHIEPSHWAEDGFSYRRCKCASPCGAVCCV